DDLEDGRAHVVDDRVLRIHHVVGRLGVDRVVDFLGRLPEEEQAAGDEDQVAPAEGGLERRLAVRPGRTDQAEVEYRGGQADDPADGHQQGKTHDQGQADADAAGPLAL